MKKKKKIEIITKLKKIDSIILIIAVITKIQTNHYN
jgi:hypothetical protein